MIDLETASYADLKAEVIRLLDVESELVKMTAHRDHWQKRAIALHDALDHVRRTSGLCQEDKDVLAADVADFGEN